MAIADNNSDHTSTPAAQVLIVEDEPDHADTMAEALRKPGHVCTIVGSVRHAMDELRGGAFDVVVTDLRMPTSAGQPALDGDTVAPDGANAGLLVLRAARALQPDAETVMVTAHGDVTTARNAFKEGAYDFIEKPLDLAVFRSLINRAAEAVLLRQESGSLGDLVQHDGFEGLIAGSEPMRRIIKTVRTVAPSNIAVLITGESGTGKELVAHAQPGSTSPSTAPARARASSKTSFSATSEAPSPAPKRTARASSSTPTTAPSSSTRSATCP
jgi:DNA-binding NtrC family response regulator